MCFKLIKLKSGDMVPCNKCPKCVARRISAWSFRLMQEESVSKSAHFVTLTYDDKHLPRKEGLYLPTLSKTEIPSFIKRLRKHQFGSRAGDIKYYGVGEYGGKTKRPHYHILLFNGDIELIERAWAPDGDSKGNFHVGQVTGASVGYTLKYMCKHYKRRVSEAAGREPEFALMSKGLGASYLQDKENVNWHMADVMNRMYCNLPGGIKVSMPRYFKEKLYWESERKAIGEVYRIQAIDAMIEKALTATPESIWNEQQAIDAAYDRMYRSTKKQMI